MERKGPLSGKETLGKGLTRDSLLTRTTVERGKGPQGKGGERKVWRDSKREESRTRESPIKNPGCSSIDRGENYKNEKGVGIVLKGARSIIAKGGALCRTQESGGQKPKKTKITKWDNPGELPRGKKRIL